MVKDKLANGTLTLSFEGYSPKEFHLRPIVYAAGHIAARDP